MVRRFGVLGLALVCFSAAGCGTKQVTVTGVNGQATTETVKNIHFANTKFLLHTGLAFGAFHHFIYLPLKHGQLSRGAPHRIATLAKGALAAAFIVHELRLAHEDALSSDQLRPLLVKLDNLETRIAGLIPGLKHGSASTTALQGAASATDSLGSASSGQGLHIRDLAGAL